MDNLITAYHVSFFYNKEHPVLQDINLRLKPGELTTLIGPNGAGKTTLIKVLLKLLKPTQGRVEHHKRLILGYVPQKPFFSSILPLTVKRFLALPGQSLSPSVRTYIEMVGISPLENRFIYELSGGQLQRVLLARALVHSPNFLILDEPVQGLDVLGQEAFYEILTSLKTTYGMGILLISHDLHLVLSSSDHVICLNEHICCEGTPDLVVRSKQYQTLFKAWHMRNLAPYIHHHDHDHNEINHNHNETE